MVERNPRYLAAWSQSFSDTQSLPRAMRGVLQEALKVGRENPGKFMVCMGRLLRFCPIGTPCRRRALRACHDALHEVDIMEVLTEESRKTSFAFSSAFRAIRYRERNAWEEEGFAGLAIVLARDDLESLWQAVRRGIPLPDLLKDPSLRSALNKLREDILDHMQTMDALHDAVLGRLITHDLRYHPSDERPAFLDELLPVEPVTWWLATYLSGRR